MKFLSDLNFPRVVILGSLLASAVTGYFVYVNKARLTQLKQDVKNAPGVVRDIQMAALELEGLREAASREGLKGEGDPEFYIRTIAQAENVDIGQVEVFPSTSVPARGVEDRRYKVKPAEKTSYFRRGSIANFLYKLEADSRRVRVTHVKIEPHEKLKPGQIGKDFWKFEAEITSRQAVATN